MSFRRNPWLFFALGVCAMIVLPFLFMEGMFADGLLYAAVSRNYSAGVGSFWEMSFSSTIYPSFHEQPPLLFFLQGLFFRAFGDSLYTERFYDLLMFLLCLFLLLRIWRLISKESGWFVLLFWLLIPTVSFAFINNLEEATMTVFVLAAFVHLMRALHLKQNPFLHLFIAGVWLVLAGMTKGVQGVFLIAAPAFWFLCLRDVSFLETVKRSVWLILPLLLFCVFAFYYEPAHRSFEAYFASRFGKTFSGILNTSDSRFFLLNALVQQLIVPLLMCLVLLFVFRKRIPFGRGWKTHRGLILFLLCCGFSGILPLLVTYEQRAFYLVTGLPFLALAAGVWLIPQVRELRYETQMRGGLRGAIRFSGICLLLAAVVLTIAFAGKPKRDADFIHDINLIAQESGKNKTVVVDDKLYNNWGMTNYAMRFHQLAFTTSPESDWVISLTEKQDAAYLASVQNKNMRLLRLYKRVQPKN
jgi:4-amino-4-deoxy-L-arabinose transferase-like glycosyltransferase